MKIIPTNPFLPGLIKGLGHLGGYFLSKMEVRNQNKYNEPINQVRRLREAGLPIAAAEAINNKQESLPDTSGIGRAGDRLGDYYKVDKSFKETGYLDSLIGIAGQDLARKVMENEITAREKEYLLNEGIVIDGEIWNNFDFRKQMEVNAMKLNNDLKGREYDILGIEKLIKEATSDEEIAIAEKKLGTMIKNLEMLDETLQNTQDFTEARNVVMKHMRDGGLSFMEAILILGMQAATGGISAGGVKIGVD